MFFEGLKREQQGALREKRDVFLWENESGCCSWLKRGKKPQETLGKVAFFSGNDFFLLSRGDLGGKGKDKEEAGFRVKAHERVFSFYFVSL